MVLLTHQTFVSFSDRGARSGPDNPRVNQAVMLVPDISLILDTLSLNAVLQAYHHGSQACLLLAAKLDRLANVPVDRRASSLVEQAITKGPVGESRPMLPRMIMSIPTGVGLCY